MNLKLNHKEFLIDYNVASNHRQQNNQEVSYAELQLLNNVYFCLTK